MSDNYTLDKHFDWTGGLFDWCSPDTYTVKDAATGEAVGEVLGWDTQDAGERIANNDWVRFEK